LRSVSPSPVAADPRRTLPPGARARKRARVRPSTGPRLQPTTPLGDRARPARPTRATGLRKLQNADTRDAV